MNPMNIPKSSIAVVIPCYRVAYHILNVIESIGQEVDYIFVVDDACPERSGAIVAEKCIDKRVRVIFHKENLGVGGAVISGYRAASDSGAFVIVKIDGDGQMDPRLISKFVEPIILGEADYTKGNRFFDLQSLKSMPRIRIFGNLALTFMSKLSTGYWNIFDPTNGYTAINSKTLDFIGLEKLSNRYFFETDMLFRLNTIRARVIDIPMKSKYCTEKSNLKVRNIFFEFLYKHTRNFIKRIFYNYYLRDISVASFELPFGFFLLSFGIIFGLKTWLVAANTSYMTPTGTIMLVALAIILGTQFILGFLSYDISMVPDRAISKSL
jgi:glycosyltransferase involved in cell wall biosynthesis